eukprot:CAMPEP_0181255310 /NCGR_PEP_ID=MMETSP1096-20121128/49080_1 /TAXON_ID=156174 ORGANISM="Chrysochromulina ericina, Strain CCMP281" /NCGR_SAMPLE_ID=MMETSP1096 /ASSEMBLY_ACC=CAM_ASM_000453 /LENGTH=66 /DNA_ID=CAMNT_0023353427 /DNA_START=855 /DNA_END=1055 /DNA_ORIENTATION=-
MEDDKANEPHGIADKSRTSRLNAVGLSAATDFMRRVTIAWNRGSTTTLKYSCVLAGSMIARRWSEG